MRDADKWNQRYRNVTAAKPPCWVLSHNQHLLPATGTALDLACGVSGDGLFMAQKGLTTSVWDSASAALELQSNWGQAQQLPLQTELRDCEQNPPAVGSFDVICVAHFLHRPACSALAAALRPGGILLYQTFCADRLDPAGPSRAEHLLQPGELLDLFGCLQTRFYREDASAGDLGQGERNRAFLVAQKAQ